MASDERSEEALQTSLGQLVRGELDGEVSPSRHHLGRQRMLDRLGEQSRPSRRPAMRAMLAAAAMILLVAGAFLLRSSLLGKPQPLTYTVEDATAASNGFIHASTRAGVVRFSDGTEVQLARGARIRVDHVDDKGAQVVLGSGIATFDVVPSPIGVWSVEAGPFTVRVTGTRFRVDWNGAEGVIVVELLEGSVKVLGPPIHDGLVLAPGQRFVGTLSTQSARVESAEFPATPMKTPPSVEGVEQDGAEQSEMGTDAAPSDASAATASDAAPPSPRTFGAMLAAGDYQQVIDAAQWMGFETTIASRPVGDVAALADAARYTGNGDLARRALLALRERFAGSGAAATAAFKLGGMSRGSEAMDWYKRYLAEAPAGPLASEAFGRQMVLMKGVDDVRASDMARQYLSRYPKGSYARVAEEILSSQ